MGIFPFKLNYSKVIVLALVTILLLLWWQNIFEFFCPIKKFTTLNCPMCKSTRAMELLLNAKLMDSFIMNPLALFWTYFLIIVYLKLFFEAFNIKYTSKLFNINYYTKNDKIKYGIFSIVFINVIYLNLFSIH